MPDKGEPTDQGNMGIRSLSLANVMNMSAMAVVAVVMVWQVRESMYQARYDREMFREELKELRTTQETRQAKSDDIHEKSLQRLSDSIDRSIAAMEKAVRAMENVNRIAIPPCGDPR